MKHNKQENIIKILNDTISPVTSEKIKSSNSEHWKNVETGNYPMLQVGEGTDMISLKLQAHTLCDSGFSLLHGNPGQFHPPVP